MMAKTKTLWLRLYTEILNDPKVQRLPDSLFRAYINFLCIAKEYSDNGVLPPKKDIAFFLRCPENSVKKLCDGLKNSGLLDLVNEGYSVHGWNNRQYESDGDPTRYSRVKRFRDNKRNGKETAEETPIETDVKRVSNTLRNGKETRIDSETETETEIDNKKEKSAREENPQPILNPQNLPASFRIQESLLSPIRLSFEHFNPQGFTDPKLEDPAILALSEKFSRLGRDRPGDFARAVLEKFHELTTGQDKFWRGQPFTPSALNNPKIFDRVLAEMKTGVGSDTAWIDVLEKEEATE